MGFQRSVCSVFFGKVPAARGRRGKRQSHATTESGRRKAAADEKAYKGVPRRWFVLVRFFVCTSATLFPAGRAGVRTEPKWRDYTMKTPRKWIALTIAALLLLAAPGCSGTPAETDASEST